MQGVNITRKAHSLLNGIIYGGLMKGTHIEALES